MKKLLLSITLFVAMFAAACSSDDDGKVNNNCDCVKTMYTYNSDLSVYVPIDGSSMFYSNNCNDDTGATTQGNANDGFYQINCTPKN